jgi:putative two-component system response regulator
MGAARLVALCHHERWDGTGYPDGRKELEIPEMARIVALADVFDALLSVRPYKQAWSIEDTLNLIRAQSGRHFEPRAVSAFLRVLPQCLAIREGYQD